MKLEKTTLDVLKNFATINQGIVFKPGNILRTVNVMKTTFVKARIPDEIPVEFAIYDLNEFLAAYSLMEDCEIEFGKDRLIMTEGNQETHYFYSSPNVVVSPGDKNIKMPQVDKSFILSDAVFNKIQKNSAVMKLRDIEITGKGLKVWNRNNEGNHYNIDMEVECDADPDDDVTNHIKVDNLKLIPLTYKVEISNKGISHFQSQDEVFDIEYFIALDVEG